MLSRTLFCSCLLQFRPMPAWMAMLSRGMVPEVAVTVYNRYIEILLCSGRFQPQQGPALMAMPSRKRMPNAVLLSPAGAREPGRLPHACARQVLAAIRPPSSLPAPLLTSSSSLPASSSSLPTTTRPALSPSTPPQVVEDDGDTPLSSSVAALRTWTHQQRAGRGLHRTTRFRVR